MKLLDSDGDGHINFDEFLVGVRVSSRFALCLKATVAGPN